MKELIEGFIAMEMELRRREIHLSQFDIMHGKIEFENGRVLPLEIARLYESLRIFKCKWTLQEDAENIEYLNKDIDFVFGQVELFHPETHTIFNTNSAKLDVLDPFKSFTEPERIRMGNYGLIDYHPGEYALCYSLDKEIDNQGLFYVDFGYSTTIRKVEMSILEYFKLGLEKKYFYGWQEAYIFGNAEKKKVIEHYLEQLFPE